MAFTDRPKVDTASENSEESVLAFRAHFKRTNGFIAREDIPDMGCDFWVEIVLEGRSENWRFPVQLKSIQTPKLIEGGQYISYPFELSRLGYLMSHKPLVGMIVLYSVNDNRFYFEYVDEIYLRIKGQHENQDWLNQDKVNIHVPTKNLLTVESREQIREKIVTVFKNHDQMYADQASQYDLPNITSVNRQATTQELIEKAEKTVRDHGMQLFEEREFALLHGLVSSLTNQIIFSNVTITLVTGLTYHEVGMFIDAEFYFQKLRRMKNLTKDQTETLEWAKLKNDYRLNKIDNKQFVERLEGLREALDETEFYNKLLLEINLLRHQIGSLDISLEIPPTYERRIKEIYVEINQLDCKIESKLYLQLMNTDLLSLLILRTGDQQVFRFGKAMAQGSLESKSEMIDFARKLDSLEEEFNQLTLALLKETAAHGAETIQAEALSQLCKSILAGTQNALVLFQKDYPFPRDQLKQRLIYYINNCILAYNLNIKHHLYYQAYYCLCDAIEFIEISKFYGVHIEIDNDELINRQKQIQEQLQLPEHNSFTMKIIQGIAS